MGKTLFFNNSFFRLLLARVVLGLAAIGFAVVALKANAATYVMPADDVVGQVQFERAKASETLFDLARRYDVGYEAIKLANPNIDPWVPLEGAKVVIPTRHILPPGPREGIVINIAELKLYHYSTPDEGPPLVSVYPISIGSVGISTKLGDYKVTKRIRKPTWNVPFEEQAEMAEQGKKVVEVIQPGPQNPLGEYAISLNTECMIHGTNKPYSIGMRAKRGCIRMYPEDIDVLIHRTAVDTPVRFINQNFKYGYKKGALYLEFHPPRNGAQINLAALVNTMNNIVKVTMRGDDWQRIRTAALGIKGVAMPVAQLKAKPGAPKAWWLQLATYKSSKDAHNLIMKIEALGVPVTMRDCGKGKCRVLAGPFTDRHYMDRVRKKVKWITRIKGHAVPYREESDWFKVNDDRLALLSQ